MLFPKIRGENLFYLYSNNQTNIELSIGIILKAISKNQKVAFIDFQNDYIKLNSFFENLSLSKIFKSENLKVDFFRFKNDMGIKSIISSVEYESFPKQKFFEKIKNYDYIIFQNLNFNNFSKDELRTFLISKNKNTFVIINSIKKEELEDLKKNIDRSYYLSCDKKNSLISNKNLYYIFSNQYELNYLISIGKIINNLIEKKEIRYIGFDLFEIFDESDFFLNLKKFTQNSPMYNKFDFVIFTKKNLEDKKQNYYEYLKFLQIVNTSLLKNGDLIIFEIYNTIREENKEFSKFLEELEKTKSKIFLFSTNYTKKIFEMCFNSEKIFEIEKEFN